MRKHNRLTPLKVSALTKPGHHGDGLNLYLQIGKTGAKSWLFRYMVDGRSRELGLGPLHTVSLAAARERAKAAREALLAGVDPLEAKREKVAAIRAQEARSMTFAECAHAYLSEHSSGWRNDKHRRQWATSLATANGAIGSFDVALIDTAMLTKLITPVWTATPETGSRLRGRIEKVLDWAMARGLREGANPARWKGHMEHLLKARPKAEHHSAMPFTDLPLFMQRLREKDVISARALEFTILTASRTSEAIGARWEEVDLDAGVWVVPAERMKAGRAHRAPLSDRAVAILKGCSDYRVSGGFVFPGKTGAPLSNWAMLELLRGMTNGLTVHGFRSSFSDWARERSAYPRDVVEMALAHSIKDKSEAAYRRGDALDKRRRLMADWSRYCSSPIVSATVTSIGDARTNGVV
jgi:integrase